MPRDPTQVVLQSALPATFANTGAAADVTGWAALQYEVANPLEPLLARVYIPQYTVATLNATATLTIRDTFVPAQIQTLQTSITMGTTAGGNAPPWIVEAPFTPANLVAAANPNFQGPRILNVQLATSAGAVSFTVGAGIVPFLQILNLARQ